MSSKRSSKLPVDLLDSLQLNFKKAEAEDLKVTAILSRARTGPTRAQETHEYAGRNAQFMDEMRLGSERALARRIESKELVSKEELIAMLGGKRRRVNDALRAGSLFSLIAPSGLEYFPAFFADETYNRRAMSRVIRALDGLPNESKYFFFTRKSCRLQATALEALAQGRTVEVAACALAFAIA